MFLTSAGYHRQFHGCLPARPPIPSLFSARSSTFLRFKFRRTSPRLLAKRYLLGFWPDRSRMADALPSFDIFYRCTFACRRFVGLSRYINYQRETPQKRRSKIPQFGNCKFALRCMPVGANPVRNSARFSAGSSNRVIKQDKIVVLQKLSDCREIPSGERNLLTFCIAMHRREPIPPAASGFRVRGLLREALAFFSRPQCHNRPCGRIQRPLQLPWEHSVEVA